MNCPADAREDLIHSRASTGDQSLAQEPEALVRGKLFHRRLQESWRGRHGGVAEPRIEKELRRHLGRRGRPDIQVDIAFEDSADGTTLFVALLEAKSRAFTTLSPRSMRRLVAQDRRQILRYVDQLTAGGTSEISGANISIAASIVYEVGPPTSEGRFEIEAYLDEAGIGVIWEDETVEVARDRLAKTADDTIRR
jgi:hypothetical protein